MQPWIIAPVTSPTDIDGILAVEESTFTSPWTREMYAAEFEQPERSHIWAARNLQGTIIGFCSFWKIVDELHINNLAVEPFSRQQGIAKALLTRILSEGARLGAERATLEVRRSNTVAQRLYSGFGFAVAGTRRDYYSAPVEDALILWHERLRDFNP